MWPQNPKNPIVPSSSSSGFFRGILKSGRARGAGEAAETELPDRKNKIKNTNNLQSALDTVDTFRQIIAPLKAFNSIASSVADIHPNAKAVLSILTFASKMILDQRDQDDAVRDLLKKLSEVYAFMDEERSLDIPNMQELYGNMARQVLECADFIVHYAETKSTWKRLAKDVFKETGSVIQRYNDVLDTLMQQCRDRHNIVNIRRVVEDMDLEDMDYARGAGRDTSKRCLPGTRKDILDEIKTWVDSTEEDVQPVFWLSGTAGKGKSAIAHTIADWFDARGGPGAFFCFDRTREADRRHEKIFTTIARNLADGDPIIRRTLANVVRDNKELRHMTDITRQWRELILGPADAVARIIAAPVLIVIDALDESGDARSREQILRVLAGKQGTISNQLNFPANVRVLITSRPAGDIYKYLHGASHVRHVSMDDTLHVSMESSVYDIRDYISTQLRDILHLDVRDLDRLAMKSDGLFEWARLTCEYISDTNMVGQDPRKRVEAVLAGTSDEGARLLDNMYRRILEDIIPEHKRQDAIPIFCSVMGQIIASLEPLPCTALNVIRQHFPLAFDRHKVEQVILPLGSLVTGTTDSHIPVRPLHASFYDFLTDKSRSYAFFVDVSPAHRHLAFASLGVLKQQLRFNICALESSYLPNSAILDLEDRVKESISVELSYSCRFFGTHIGATSVERPLVEAVKAFFDDELLLFWLEVVSLLKVVGGAVATLSCIANWLTDHSEYTDTVDAVRDTRHFLRTFAPAILCSTPHLYLSALPFAPIQSTISKRFVARFPLTPRVVAGHVVHWPSMEKTIPVYSCVRSLKIFPDGRRIVCGSEDGTIHVRGMETGEVFGAPLLGHSKPITSIAIPPNGTCIVSGSHDKTIRVWDAGTGEALGVPLQGHVDSVYSVAVLPNGSRIMSGSRDGTIRVWDMVTGEELGVLTGHTDTVTSIAISPNGNHIVSGSFDYTLRMWDMDTGKALGEPLRGHTDCVYCIAISPDGNYIASGSFDKTIQMWDATTGVSLGEPLEGHTGDIITIAISSDWNTIASGSTDSTIRLWDVQTHQALGMLQGHAGAVLCVAVSPDACRIVSCSVDNTIRVWAADTSGSFTAPLKLKRFFSVAISPDGRRIVSCSDDNMIQMWDAYTGKALLAPLQGHTNYIWSVAISSDRIVSGSSDKTVRVWDAETGEVLGSPLPGNSDQVGAVAISSDGTRIVSGSADKIIRVWDTLTGNALGTPLQGHTDLVWSVAISLDGNLIISGSSDKTIRVWDTETGEALGAPLLGHTDTVSTVAISPDRKRIVSGSIDTTIRVWDMATREALGVPLQGHAGEVWAVAISPGTNLIASGSSDKTIRVWDARTGEVLGAPLQGHTGVVSHVAISPDGKRIVSCSDDATIRVWNLEFFTQPQLFESPAICFSSDPIHALDSSSSFQRDLPTPVHLAPNEEGWIVGPDGRLLLWVPAALYPAVYISNILVGSDDALQVDLSQFAHGESWYKCRVSF